MELIRNEGEINMKKRILTIVLAMTLIMCANISAFAASEPNYCPCCGEVLSYIGNHLDNWSITRTFKDASGKTVYCNEYYSVDNYSKYCSKGCGFTYTSPAVTTVNHSLSSCPYK